MRRAIALLAVAFFATTVGACEDTATSGPRSTESEYDRFVDEVSVRLPELLQAEAAERAASIRADSLLEAGPGDSVAPALDHPLVLRQLYAEREQLPAWVDPAKSEKLSEAGARLVQELEEAVAIDGLWHESVHLDRIDRLRSAAPSVAQEPLAEASLTEGEQVSLAHWLKANQVDVDKADPRTLLHRWSRLTGPVPRLGALLETRVDQVERERERALVLDLTLSDALIHYAKKMRFDHAGWYGDDQVELPEPEDPNALGRTDRPEGTQPLPEARVDAVLTALKPVFSSPETVGRVAESLRPPFEQYERLRVAHQAYVERVDAGGWESLAAEAVGLLAQADDAEQEQEKAAAPARGDAAAEAADQRALLEALRRRLETEGYSVGQAPPGEPLAPLRDALRDYQRAHRIEAKGELDEETLDSLNVPAIDRLAQLRLNLQRWRESPIGDDPYYIYVNVADSTAEVWRDEKRRMRFRVVVGAGKEVWDAALGRKVWQGATPRFSDSMEILEFNPYWWIPRSIWVNELAPKQRMDPGYYARKGYEYGTTEGGVTKLRQRPGPDNALGQVKFLFPNDHAVYLHDTPHDDLFSESVRNFSHGCMRVEKPEEFAKFLLIEDGKGSPEEVEAQMATMFERDEPTPVQLDRPVPVHIDYITTRVDDDGAVEFLRDFYELDPERLRARAEHRSERRARMAASDALEHAKEEL